MGEKITAKTAVNFLEIEVWQEKRGDRCYGSVNATKDLNVKAKNMHGGLTVTQHQGAGKESRISTAEPFNESLMHMPAIHGCDR